MAGGEAADIARVQPLMADIAARFTHVGLPGAGLVAKMINQLIVGCGYAVMAEAPGARRNGGHHASRVPRLPAGGHADGSLPAEALSATGSAISRRRARAAAAERPGDGERMLGGLKALAPMMGEALSLYRMLVHRGYSEPMPRPAKLYEKEKAK